MNTPASWTQVAEGGVHDESIRLHAAGDGPAVLLLHGLEDSWTTWGPLAGELSAYVRCYAADLPWRTGNRYGWRSTPDLGVWARAAFELVPEPVVAVVGHSLGANALMQWAGGGGAPPATEAMVLLAPFFQPPGRPMDWAAYDRALNDYRNVMAAGLRANLGDRVAVLDAELLDIMTAKTIDRIGPMGFISLFDHYLGTTGLDLSRATLPTLIVGGSGDPPIAGDRGPALRDRFPDARLYAAAHLSHFCHVEQTGEIAERVLAFLQHGPSAEPASRTERP